MSTPIVLEPRADPLQALLIDDNPNDRELFSAVIRRCGQSLTVAAADSGEAGIEWLRRSERAPDIVFLDLHLPGLRAREVVDWIRGRPEFARTLIIAVTADVGCACSPARAEGASAVLVKPVAVEDVDAMVALARVLRVG